MSHLTTSEDLPSATFSPVSASGPIRSVSPDGLTIARSGLVPARASLSARQAKEMGLLTSGTFGPTSSISSASADLSMYLANRLQAVTQTHGSTLYRQTWKEWDTPSGLCRLRQRASARRTSERELTGWPSPLASNVKNCYQDWLKVLARKEAGRQPNLQDFAVLAAWTTPTSRDWKDTSGMTAQRDGKERLDQLPRQAFMTGWPTPQAIDGNNGVRAPRLKKDGRRDLLTEGSYRTDLKDIPYLIFSKPPYEKLNVSAPLRLTVFGEMRTGSYVEMGNGVQLNPAHSRWLMGLPRAWDESSPGWQEWQAATASADSKATATP